MRRIARSVILSGALLAAGGWVATSSARPIAPMVQEIDLAIDRMERGSGGGATAHADTAWFGGSGTGNGTVVRGGVWNWEAASGEAPEFFPDGDPVGNQYRD